VGLGAAIASGAKRTTVIAKTTSIEKIFFKNIASLSSVLILKQYGGYYLFSCPGAISPPREEEYMKTPGHEMPKLYDEGYVPRDANDVELCYIQNTAV
jgi:hypothetical protein